MWHVVFPKYLFIYFSVSACAQCRDCMSAALAASKILKTMAEEESDADEAEAMKELADHYEKHAIGKILQTQWVVYDVNIEMLQG